MSKKNIVYSTNPNFQYEDDDDMEMETLAPEEQDLKVMIDRKQRKGKSVTLITGFEGSDEDLQELGKTLKQKCGVGGSAKNGEIIVQGENKEKIFELLLKMGYRKTKKVGG
ncbi:MAG TPA: translation initiation factor [Vicingaceae bacterium]|nr:translation initiation factor [Vicingaceae bacterium]